jgi:hypothetical protein
MATRLPEAALAIGDGLVAQRFEEAFGAVLCAIVAQAAAGERFATDQGNLASIRLFSNWTTFRRARWQGDQVANHRPLKTTSASQNRGCEKALPPGQPGHVTN